MSDCVRSIQFRIISPMRFSKAAGGCQGVKMVRNTTGIVLTGSESVPSGAGRPNTRMPADVHVIPACHGSTASTDFPPFRGTPMQSHRLRTLLFMNINFTVKARFSLFSNGDYSEPNKAPAKPGSYNFANPKMHAHRVCASSAHSSRSLSSPCKQSMKHQLHGRNCAIDFVGNLRAA